MEPSEPMHGAGPGPKILRCRKSWSFNSVLRKERLSLEIQMKNKFSDRPLAYRNLR
jgi:hypothetical protein